eukprot:Pgem_evm1s12392
MKIITSRIVPILPSIISPDQTCNVPGRTIEDSIKFMQTTIWDMNSRVGIFIYSFRRNGGVNQGDPLSPILYIIAGEVLRLKVKTETKVITASYADDANYITTNQRQTLAVLKIAIAFGEEVTGNMIHL